VRPARSLEIENSQYIESTHSIHFPFLPLAEVQAFLLRRKTMDETSLIKAFRQWVRQVLANRAKN
jgi:hypothetical protein